MLRASSAQCKLFSASIAPSAISIWTAAFAVVTNHHSSAPPQVDKHWRVLVCDFNLSKIMEEAASESSVGANNPRCAVCAESP